MSWQAIFATWHSSQELENWSLQMQFEILRPSFAPSKDGCIHVFLLLIVGKDGGLASVRI